MIHSSIKLAELIGNTLNTRDEADRLFDHLASEVLRTDVFILDFDEIIFMSRSFADQFHKRKLQWQEEYIVPLQLEQLPQQSHEILCAVAATQKKHKREVVVLPRRSFKNYQELINFLQAV